MGKKYCNSELVLMGVRATNNKKDMEGNGQHLSVELNKHIQKIS